MSRDAMKIVWGMAAGSIVLAHYFLYLLFGWKGVVIAWIFSFGGAIIGAVVFDRN